MNEIDFLLNFDFEGSGTKELEAFLQKMVALFGDVNDVTKLSSTEIQKVGEKMNALVEIMRRSADAVANYNQSNKEQQRVIHQIYTECVQLKGSYESLLNTQKNIIKTSEELTGEFQKASEMVKKLAGELLKMETDGHKGTKMWQEKVDVLSKWKAVLIESKVEMDKFSASQEKLDGVISSTKAKIKELTTALEKFKTEEELSGKEATELKDKIASLSEFLKQLQKETNGQLTLESALNKVRNENITLTNQLVAIEEKDVQVKADLTLAQQKYTASVKETIVAQTSEKGSINDLRLRVEQLRAEWAKLGPSARESNKALQADLIKTQKELEMVEAQSKKTSLELSTMGRALQFLNTSFFRGVGTLVVWGAAFAAIFKGWELFTQGTEAFKQAREELLKYQDKLKDIEKSVLSDMAAKTSLYQEQLLIARDITQTDKTRLDAIRQLRKEHGGLLEQYRDEAFLKGKTAEIEKKLKEQTELEAKASIARKKSGAATARKIEAEDELRDLSYLKDRALEIQKQATKELDERGLPKLKGGRGTKSLRLTKEEAELIAQEQGSVDFTKIFDENTPEGRNARELQDKSTWWQKTFGDGKRMVNVWEVESRIKALKQAAGNADKDVEFYNKKASEFTSKAIGIQGQETGKLNENALVAKIQELEDEIRGNIDLREYGLSIDNITDKEIRKIKGKIDLGNNQKLEDLVRYRDALRELRGQRRGTGRHVEDKSYEEARALEKEKNQTAINQINLDYEEGGKSEVDNFERHIALQKQADEHLKAMEAINKKYEKSTKDSKLVIAKYREDDKNHHQKYLIDIQKDANRDLEESRKYHEQKLDQIREFNRKVEEINENYRQKALQEERQKNEQSRQERRAGRFNPIQAFFGGGAGSTSADWADDEARMQESVDQAQQNKAASHVKFYLAQLTANASEDKVKQNDKIPEAFQTEIQRKQFSDDRDTHNKNLDELAEKQKQFQNDDVKLQAALGEQKLNQMTKEQQQKVEIAEAGFNAVQRIATTEFNLQAQRIRQEMDSVRSRYALERTLAGNNSAAKIRIAMAEQQKMKELKKAEAKNQKNAALFSAITNTSVAVTAALAQGGPIAGPILAGIVGAMGLYEIGRISSQKPPEYWKGRKGGPKEIARVNDAGPELIEGKDGSMRIASGGKDTYTLLNEGDTVHTHERSMDILKTSRVFLNHLLQGSRNYKKDEKNQKINVVLNSLSKGEYEDAMVNAINRTKERERYIHPSVSSRNDRLQKRNL